MASELTDLQRRFCEEYLVDLNATAAAKRAGYSEKTARSIGSENLSKPDIQAAIAELKEARSIRTRLTADTVLERLDLIMLRCMPLPAIPEGENPLDYYARMNQEQPGREFLPIAALKAGELIGKHLGVTEKTESTVKHKGEIDVNVNVVDLEDRIKQLKGTAA